MKKVFLTFSVFVIALMAVSCQKEEANVIHATIMNYQGPNGKVYLDDRYACWNENDQVSVNGTAANVTGNTEDAFDIAYTARDGEVLNAIYPASITTSNSFDASSTTASITLPQEQTYAEVDGNQQIYAPMVAKTTANENRGANLKFYNACSLIKVQVTGGTWVNSITVTADEVEDATNTVQSQLWGTATVDFDAHSVTMSGTDGGNSVTLNVDAAREDGIYYVVVPAISGVKVTVSVNYNAGAVNTVWQDAESHLDANYIGPVEQIATTKGQYSVSATKKVTFAKGNLQYIGSASTPYWKFADEQYEYFSSRPGATTSDWDLFGWSTSATTYGMSTSNSYLDYSGDFVEWGRTMNNGADTPWHTLEGGEWAYLFNEASGQGRTNASTLWSRIQITVGSTDYYGLVLFPDDWSWTTGIGLTLANNGFVTKGRWSVSTNQIDESTWLAMEAEGAVFLPACGTASGTTINYQETQGHYWGSTYSPTAATSSAQALEFSDSQYSGRNISSENRSAGNSVRLARPAPTTTSSK